MECEVGGGVEAARRADQAPRPGERLGGRVGQGRGEHRVGLRDERRGVRGAFTRGGSRVLGCRGEPGGEERGEDHRSSRAERPSLLKRSRTALASRRDPVIRSDMRSKSPPVS